MHHLTPGHTLGPDTTAAVLGDVAENLFTLLLLWIYPNGYLPGLETVLGLGMVGYLELMGWGLAVRR